MLLSSSETPRIRSADAIERRLLRWLEVYRSRRLASLDRIEARALDPQSEPALRSILSSLAGGGGCVERQVIRSEMSTLSEPGRRALRQLGIVTGSLDLFHPALLKPEAVRARVAIDAARKGVPMPALPMPGLTLLDAPSVALAHGAAAAGYRSFGNQMVRVDLVERIARAVHAQRHGQAAFSIDPGEATALGIGEETLGRILRALGFRQAEGKGVPTMWRWQGVRHRRATKARPDNPSFAILSTLRGGGRG
jgi:ATP-dependent RNA helicase SUPV3L1/SUV3